MICPFNIWSSAFTEPDFSFRSCSTDKIGRLGGVESLFFSPALKYFHSLCNFAEVSLDGIFKILDAAIVPVLNLPLAQPAESSKYIDRAYIFVIH